MGSMYVNVGRYTSPMDPMGLVVFVVCFLFLRIRLYVRLERGLGPLHSYSFRMGLEPKTSSSREGSGFLGIINEKLMNTFLNCHSWWLKEVGYEKGSGFLGFVSTSG